MSNQERTLRERILDAAEDLLRAQGLARTTTREIAHRAGCSEGSLYVHFDSKEALFLAVLTERMPGLIPLVKSLHERVGTGDLRATLEEIARTAIAFYSEVFPMSAAVLATPALRDGLRMRGMGPHRANEAIAAYLRRELELGRIRAGASPEAAAALLLGACQQRIFLRRFHGEQADDTADATFVQELVDTLMGGLVE